MPRPKGSENKVSTWFDGEHPQADCMVCGSNRSKVVKTGEPLTMNDGSIHILRTRQCKDCGNRNWKTRQIIKEGQ